MIPTISFPWQGCYSENPRTALSCVTELFLWSCLHLILSGFPHKLLPSLILPRVVAVACCCAFESPGSFTQWRPRSELTKFHLWRAGSPLFYGRMGYPQSTTGTVWILHWDSCPAPASCRLQKLSSLFSATKELQSSWFLLNADRVFFLLDLHFHVWDILCYFSVFTGVAAVPVVTICRFH